MWDLLFICDGFVAAVADPHFKLKAHERDGRALGATLAAHGLPTLPAVVLGEKGDRLPWLWLTSWHTRKLTALGEDTRSECPRAGHKSTVLQSQLMPGDQVFGAKLGLNCVLSRRA